jgi:hypothetical protein
LASNALVGGATAAARTLDPFAQGRAGAEAAALRLADSSAPVAIDDHGGVCPLSRLVVQWSPPAAGQYQNGAYLDPLGAPGAGDNDANGIVVCDDSSFGYLGFEAFRLPTGEWKALAVPTSEDGSTGDSPAQASPGVPLPAGLASVQQGSPWFDRWGSDIEPLAAYDPQSTCDPTPKIGVAAFRALVRQQYPDSTDLGIGQACSVPGLSEHKEGRAWDFGVRVDNPSQDAEANALISWLLATDEYGNRYAMARRLGVMYIIWDGHIWGSYKADEGWRPYSGPNPHTDHVHLSFDRAGALGQTSFWNVVPLSGVGEFASVFSSGGFGLGPVPPPHELGRHPGSTSSASRSGSSSGTSSPASGPGAAPSSSDPGSSLPSSGPSQPGQPAPSGPEAPGAPGAPGTPDQPVDPASTATPIDDLLAILPVPTTLVDPNAVPVPLPVPLPTTPN